MNEPIRSNRFNPENERCRHTTRLELLEGLCKVIQKGISHYAPDLDDGSIDMQSQSIIALMESGCRASQKYSNVFRALYREPDSCQRCQRTLRHRDAEIHGPDAIAERIQAALSGATKLVLDSNNQLIRHSPHEPVPEENGESNEPVDDAEAYFQSKPVRARTDIYMGVSLMTEEEIKARTIRRRIRHGIPAIRLDHVSYQARKLKDDIQFDDYFSGPSIESLHVPRSHGLQTMVPTLGTWGLFKDWGFRLRPFSLHQFYLTEPHPDVILAHIFSIPSPEILDNRTQSRALMELDSFQAFSGGVERIGKYGPVPRSLVESDHTVTWSLDDILNFNHTGPLNSHESCTAYVQGLSYDSQDQPRFIIMDLEKDAVRVPPKHVTISIDIDSVIWVTFQLSVKASVGVHVLPHYGKKPPIYINNHVYIDILCPRSDEDIASGGRFEWFEKRVPVSHIPHTHFACVGQGYGAANIYVFFPRMIHRKELLPFWDVRMPRAVQSSWLTNVVYRALKMVTKNRSAIAPYVDFTLDEMLNKSGHKLRKTLPVDANDLLKLQKQMRNIVNGPDPDGELSHFGSFFFLLDIKGIKMLTTTDDPDSCDPFQKLRLEFAALDWEYMMDRKNGELMLDLGIGFHPPLNIQVPGDDESIIDPEVGGPREPGGPWGPLTGLWRREQLENSYDTAGFNKGTSHSACTFSNYGGIQAEMPRARAEQVHINFRQSYNLAYEVIRGPKSRERVLFTPKDAYTLNETFRRDTQNLANGFFSSVKKSYGVRDEFRVSGSSVLELLPMIKTRVMSSPFCK